MADKLSSHNGETPLHRAFSCYIFNTQGDFLVTQRAKSKKTWPGIWSNSCCGHVAPGESNEVAVRRRVSEELGLELRELAVILPDYRYRAELDGIVENEICPVFAARVDTEPKPNSGEVENYYWISWDGFLAEIINNPDKFSWWCKDQVKQLGTSHLFRPYLEGSTV